MGGALRQGPPVGERLGSGLALAGGMTRAAGRCSIQFPLGRSLFRGGGRETVVWDRSSGGRFPD